MLPLKLLFRAARRLHQAWSETSTSANPRHVLERLQNAQGVCQHTNRLLDKACSHRLLLTANRLRRHLAAQLRAIQELVTQARQALEQSTPPLPASSDWIGELRQLETEFDEFRMDWSDRAIIVTTQPITLEGIHLGPFAIQFFWERVAHQTGSGCFDVVALEANPPDSNELVTHPHVKDGQLCAGEATLPLRLAVADGRLADAFCLIRGVLTHYNRHSPYVPLEEWHGIACADCGRNTTTEDRCSCRGCDQDYCDECIGSCSVCGRSRCPSCLMRCEICDEPCCGRCLQACACSGRDCCPDCRVNCAACGATVARDEVNAQTQFCSSCQQLPPPPVTESVNAPMNLMPSMNPVPVENEHAPTPEWVPPTTT